MISLSLEFFGYIFFSNTTATDAWLSAAAGLSGLIVHIGIRRPLSPPPPLPPTLNSKIWKLRQTKISFCVLQGSHHRRCRRPGGLCTNWMHSWPNTELHCMLRKMNYDHRIAVSVFCACAGICPIFKAKNTLEIVCNLSRTCVVEIGWSFYLHLHRFLRFPQTSDSYAFTLS